MAEVAEVETEEVSEEVAPEATEETTEEVVDLNDWRQSIKDEKVRAFADRFTSPVAAVETAYKFQQTISKGITVPGKDADEDTVKDFRKKLGIPDAPEGYKVDPPKGLPEELQVEIFESDDGKAVLDRFRTIAHQANIPPAGFQAMVAEFATLSAEGTSQQAKMRAEAVDAANDALKKEWGKDFDANENYGIQAVKTFDQDGSLTAFLEETIVDGVQLGNHPAFRKAWANVGRNMGEDGFHVTPGEGETQGIQEELDSLYDLMDSNETKYRSNAVQNRIQALEGKLHGDGAIVGSGGRSA